MAISNLSQTIALSPVTQMSSTAEPLPQLEAMLAGMDTMMARVEAMMAEINTFRQMLQSMIYMAKNPVSSTAMETDGITETAKASVTAQLAGSFGPATADDMEFDKNLYWERFIDESTIV